MLNLGMEVKVKLKSCNRGGYCNLNEIVFSFQPFKEAGMYYLTWGTNWWLETNELCVFQVSSSIGMKFGRDF